MNQKSQSPTSLLRGSINRAIISAGLTPTKESLYEQIHQTFTLEESLRMAYIPVLLNKTAFHFAEEVCRQCAEMKMPYKHETRAIRQATSSYISSTLGQSVSSYTLRILEEKAQQVFQDAGSNVQTLWFVINSELKKQYPQLDSEYEFLTNVYCGVSLLFFVMRYDDVLDAEVERRTGLKHASFRTPETTDVYNALLAIGCKYPISRTDTLNLALRIISIKVEEIVRELYDIHKRNVEGGVR